MWSAGGGSPPPPHQPSPRPAPGAAWPRPARAATTCSTPSSPGLPVELALAVDLFTEPRRYPAATGGRLMARSRCSWTAGAPGCALAARPPAAATLMPSASSPARRRPSAPVTQVSDPSRRRCRMGHAVGAGPVLPFKSVQRRHGGVGPEYAAVGPVTSSASSGPGRRRCRTRHVALVGSVHDVGPDHAVEVGPAVTAASVPELCRRRPPVTSPASAAQDVADCRTRHAVGVRR